jgi:hypothetical protein
LQKGGSFTGMFSDNVFSSRREPTGFGRTLLAFENISVRGGSDLVADGGRRELAVSAGCGGGFCPMRMLLRVENRSDHKPGIANQMTSRA